MRYDTDRRVRPTDGKPRALAHGWATERWAGISPCGLTPSSSKGFLRSGRAQRARMGGDSLQSASIWPVAWTAQADSPNRISPDVGQRSLRNTRRALYSPRPSLLFPTVLRTTARGVAVPARSECGCAMQTPASAGSVIQATATNRVIPDGNSLASEYRPLEEDLDAAPKPDRQPRGMVGVIFT